MLASELLYNRDTLSTSEARDGTHLEQLRKNTELFKYLDKSTMHDEWNVTSIQVTCVTDEKHFYLDLYRFVSQADLIWNSRLP